MRTQRRYTLLAFVLTGLAGLLSTPLARTESGASQTVLLPVVYRAPAQFGSVGQSEFGLAFVNSAEKLSSDARIQRGLDAGARLDRFPLYWNYIERSAGQFDWTRQDAALRANERKGLGTLVILLGTPSQYYPFGFQFEGEVPMPPVGGGPLRTGIGEMGGQGTCSAPGPPPPRGLHEPIFADGSDRPAPGKVINAANPWARFVKQAVERYRPGGSAGLHVRHWEVWNEPDLCQFWSGSVEEYARLLKVAYLVIKQSDPQATVMWGGLAHHQQPQFLTTLLSTLRNDPLAAEFDGFFDAAASHHYSNVTNGYNSTRRIRDALAGTPWVNKPIWITESGVPVCDDYPGPKCPSPYRANPEEQASYIWQNVAYTRLAGGGPIFHFQLHDDCGNVVAPNSPDGFGLVKNEPTSYCSPSNAEPRLSYTAFQLATRYLSGTELLWADIQDGKVRRVAFYHPGSKERRLLVWAIDGDGGTARIPATGTTALRLELDGSGTALSPASGEYQIPVPRATNQNYPGTSIYTIGGKPYLLIERDTLPPTSTIAALAPTSPLTFTVSWQTGDLGSGVAEVALWQQEDQGEWQLWLADQPAVGSAPFTGEIGKRYRFAVMAKDRAGNAPAAPTAQAETLVAPPTPTPTATATATPVPEGGDLIQNGSFERDEGWFFADNGPATGSYTSEQAHSGRRAARLGLPPPADDLTSYSSVSQPVSLPADLAAARLALWLWPRSEDDLLAPSLAAPERALAAGATPEQFEADRQQVLLLDAQRRFLALLWSAVLDGAGWQPLEFDLSAYRGQTVWVYVNVVNDGDGRRTWLYLDDVSLTVTRPATPTPTATATMAATSVAQGTGGTEGSSLSSPGSSLSSLSSFRTARAVKSSISTEILAVEMYATPSQVLAGGRLRYDIVVHNRATTELAGIAVTDELPPGFHYVPGSTIIRSDGRLLSRTEPTVNGRRLQWSGLPAPAGAWGNAHGIHTFVQDRCTDTAYVNFQLDRARALMGAGAYVRQLFYPVTPSTSEAPSCWRSFVEAAYNRDLRPIIRLGGRFEGDSWQKPLADSPGNYATIAAAFARVVTGLPRRDGVPLIIEVWNEPNLNVEWSGSANPTEYGAFLRDVAAAIRGLNDSRILIANGGLSPGGDISNEVFVDRMLAVPGVLESFDLWSTHPYPSNHPPEYNIHDGTARYTRSVIDSYLIELARLRAAGRSGFKVLLTETGYALGDAGYAWDGFAAIDEENRADYISRAFSDYWQDWPEVQAVTPYELVDPFENWAVWDWLYPNGALHRQYEVVAVQAKPQKLVPGTLSVSFEVESGPLGGVYYNRAYGGMAEHTFDSGPAAPVQVDGPTPTPTVTPTPSEPPTPTPTATPTEGQAFRLYLPLLASNPVALPPEFAAATPVAGPPRLPQVGLPTEAVAGPVRASLTAEGLTLARGTGVRHLRAEGPLWSVALSEDGERLAASAPDGRVLIWTADGELLAERRELARPGGLVWHGDTLIVAETARKRVAFLAPPTYAILRTIPAGEAPFALALAPRRGDAMARLFAADAGTGTIFALGVDRGTILWQYDVGGLDTLLGLAYDPGSDRLFAAYPLSARFRALVALDATTGTVAARRSGDYRRPLTLLSSLRFDLVTRRLIATDGAMTWHFTPDLQDLP